VRRLEIAALSFPLLQTKEDFERGTPPASIREAQEVIQWAHHLVILYPLWLGSMPALLKGFCEQVFRPGFAFEYQPAGAMPKKLLTGKSARLIVTMGMPALVYRWIFFAHSLRSLKRNILSFVGISPVKTTVIGSIEAMNEKQRADWLDRLRNLGERGL
jgi:putative NADPH-quinone reductase